MKNHYAPISVWLHWLIFILFICAYSSIEFRVLFEKGTDARNLMKYAHFLFGLSILVLVGLRIVARLVTPKVDRESYNKFQRYASTIMFTGLYVLMIAQPLLGWATVSAEGHTIDILGFTLPALIAEDNQLAKQIQEFHELLGTTGYVLIGLHALAALIHHYFVGDNTLKRMLRFSSKNGD
ncbi:MAG: cytochrome b561 [Paraglaciecola sp.]|jgi:cytochrome b561